MICPKSTSWSVGILGWGTFGLILDQTTIHCCLSAVLILKGNFNPCYTSLRITGCDFTVWLEEIGIIIHTWQLTKWRLDVRSDLPKVMLHAGKGLSNSSTVLFTRLPLRFLVSVWKLMSTVFISQTIQWCIL